MAKKRHLSQPFAPWIDHLSRILILGSFPSIRAIEVGFYYGNERNRFYRVLSELLRVDLVTCSGTLKKKILLEHHIAIHDVIQSCDINGSSDATIRNVVVADIRKLMKKYSIRHIFINGKTAGRLFDEFFSEFQTMRTILPSSSPANAQYRLPQLIDSWSPILSYI